MPEIGLRTQLKTILNWLLSSGPQAYCTKNMIMWWKSLHRVIMSISENKPSVNKIWHCIHKCRLEILICKENLFN